MQSFPSFHFDVIKVSLASRIEHQRLTVLRTGHGRNPFGLQSFWSPIVLISVALNVDDVLQGSRIKKKKVWSIGGYNYEDLFLIHDDI